MITRIFSAAALVALVAVPALAQSGDVDATLAALSGAQGAAYTTARDEAVKNLKSADLEAKLASATWTDKTFAELSMATIVLSYQKDAAAVAKVYHLDGVNEAVYSRWRINRPDATRELNALADRANGPLLEIYTKTFDTYGFSATEASALKEKLALRIGIVVALGKTRHPSAVFVAKQLANSAAELEGVRNQAAGALGNIDSADAVAELVKLHDAAGTPESLKLAALRGAAWSSRAEAFALIAKDLESDNAALRRQAAVALGTFSAPGAWDARNAKATGLEFRSQAAAKLVAALTSDRLPADVLVEQLGVIADASSKTALDAAAANDKLTAAQRDTAKKAAERVQLNLDRNK